MNPSQITIGLTTFNRKNLLLKCLPSIKRLHQDHDYLVCDDASSEMTEEFLKLTFQNWRVFRASQNSGRADFAMARLMDLFLETGKDYLVILDSDLLVDPELSTFMCNYAELTDGVFSVFNAPFHPVISEDEVWAYKNHIGAAGTVLSRSLIKEIRANVTVTKQFDWDWSAYLIKTGRKIRVSKRSYVQHLGFSNGQNADNFLMGDLGLNFQNYDKEALSIFLDEYLHSERSYIKSTVNILHQMILNQQSRILELEELIRHTK